MCGHQLFSASPLLKSILTLNLNAQFHTLTSAYGLADVRLQKLNALGAESREDQLSQLNTDDLNPETIRWIHDHYTNDFGLGFEKRNEKGGSSS